MPNPYVNKVVQSGSYGSGETSIETQSAYYITGTYGVVKAKPNTSDTTFKVEKYPVNAGDTYRISGSVYGDTSVYSFYDAEENPVKWYNDKGGSSYHAVVGVVDTAPSNAVYLYVAHVTNKGDALVEKRIDTPIIDISDTTAVASDVASGKYFYLATGEKVVGSGPGGSGYTRTVIAPQQTVTPTTSDGQTKIILSTASGTLVDGADYIITFNGDEYWYTCQDLWGAFKFVGESAYLWGTSSEQPYPCTIYDSPNEYNNLVLIAYDGYANTQVTVKVEKIELTGSGGGGGSATLITKSITANGTYSAEDDGADGYSEVTVDVPTGSSKNVQTEQSTSRRNNTALGSINSLTCSTAGTYDVYWSCARTSTSGTWGSQLYINGTAYGTENTTFSNHVQDNHLTGVTIPANATVAVYGRSRSGYYIYAPQLTIVQTA